MRKHAPVASHKGRKNMKERKERWYLSHRNPGSDKKPNTCENDSASPDNETGSSVAISVTNRYEQKRPSARRPVRK